MLELIRASSLQGFPELVRELGADPDPLLVGVGIDPEIVGDLEAYVTYRSVADVVARAATQLGCDDFGMRLSTRQGLEILGPVALIARHASTAGEGLQAIAKYLHVYSPAIAIALEPLTAGEARYTFSILASGLPDRGQVEELALGVALEVFRLLIGRNFRPLRVALPHAPISKPARYRDFFDADVQFEQDRCGFDLRADLLARPLGRVDPLVHDLAERFLAGAAPAAAPDRPLIALRALITRALPTGQCNIQTIARALALHPRTLQRHLASDGLTFSQIVDAVRRDQARRYLTETTMPMSQLSTLLGYSEQSSLSRACVSWFGTSPRAIRSRPSTAGAKPESGHHRRTTRRR